MAVLMLLCLKQERDLLFLRNTLEKIMEVLKKGDEREKERERSPKRKGVPEKMSRIMLTATGRGPCLHV